MAPEFKENLIGRLGNFPLSAERCLLPLFEAVSNSIHAIEDSKRKDGEITIHIHRAPVRTLPLTPETRPIGPITGFTIEDNGVGFNDTNFASFCTADSIHKKARGGKGVGRLSWLKVFEKAEVSSVYADPNGALKHRSFTFQLAEKPIDGYSDEAAPDSKVGTVVHLIGMNTAYQKACPKNCETVARRLIDHFLTMFVLSTCPVIRLVDKDEKTELSLNKQFQQEIGQHSTTEKFTLKGITFSLQHFRMATKSPQPNHDLHFCARGRSVETRDVAKLLSNLNGPLKDNTGSFAYAGYVSGELLDETVNQERTRLELLHDDSLFANGDEPTREDLLKELAKRSETFLAPHLTPIKETKLNRIKEYIQKRPLFRPIIKLRPEWLDDIRADISDDDLDIELYKLVHKIEIQVRTDGVALRTKQSQKTAESIDDHKKKFEKFLDESNQVGFSKLADYVVHRRAVIEFLSECMKLDDDGRYKLEEVVHDVIYPMKATSNDVPDADQSNLWMIDERLAYHYYLCSDMEFRGTDEIEVKQQHERERIDLLVLQPYERPHAFVGTTNRPFDSVTIIEFRRPNRDDYSPDDEDRDPIAQVWKYAKKIQDGKAKDKTGQFVRTGEGTQFYAYVICNLTPKMNELAEFHSFTPMPDGMGYFRWQPNYKVYTEILDYRKLIQDAKKRNQVFFDKFNLPPII